MKNSEGVFLYVGCGHHRMAGFLHLEINPGKNKSGQPEIIADMSDYIPLPDNSADLVYSRATLEHLTYRELVNHLLECQRILKPGGCVRAVVPDFETFINEYRQKIYWPEMEKNLDFPNENYVDTFVYRMNYHDHFYLHNFDTLARVLDKTGFLAARLCEPGISLIKEAEPELLKSEICMHGQLIIEAQKGGEIKIKRFEKIYPKNPVKKILAKYFNINISPFIKRRPMFPHKYWFIEKVKKTERNSRSFSSGSHGQKFAEPKYEKYLQS